MSDVEREGRWFVDRQYGSKPSERTDAGRMPVRVFPEGVPPAHVNVKLGMTLNLGDYDSCRIDVGITQPCYREERDDCFQDCWDFVEEKIRAEIRKVRRPNESLEG